VRGPCFGRQCVTSRHWDLVAVATPHVLMWRVCACVRVCVRQVKCVRACTHEDGKGGRMGERECVSGCVGAGCHSPANAWWSRGRHMECAFPSFWQLGRLFARVVGKGCNLWFWLEKEKNARACVCPLAGHWCV